MMKRIGLSALLAGLLAVVIHADWHLARPAHMHHRLSFGLPYHWALAIPVFALAALVMARLWPDDFARASVYVLLSAIVAGQVLEPLGEQAVYFHRFGLGIQPARWSAFGAFVAAGLVAYVATAVVLRFRAIDRAGAEVVR